MCASNEGKDCGLPSAGGVTAAQAMAKRLMHCYGELRQLEALLESLILSLGKSGCLPAATAIICNPGTLAALHAVCPPRFRVSNEANAFRSASCCKVVKRQSASLVPEVLRCLGVLATILFLLGVVT